MQRKTLPERQQGCPTKAKKTSPSNRRVLTFPSLENRRADKNAALIIE